MWQLDVDTYATVPEISKAAITKGDQPAPFNENDNNAYDQVDSSLRDKRADQGNQQTLPAQSDYDAYTMVDTSKNMLLSSVVDLGPQAVLPAEPCGDTYAIVDKKNKRSSKPCGEQQAPASSQPSGDEYAVVIKKKTDQ